MRRLLVVVAAMAGCEPGLSATDTPLITVQGGTFPMGSSKTCQDSLGVSCGGDRPQHLVRVSAFLLQATEVSRIQYASCVLAGGCVEQDSFDPRHKDEPALIDNPDDGARYCATLGMRLPTEAEFEFAARVDSSGRTHDYPWGDKAPTCDVVSFAGCGTPRSADVGSAPGDVSDIGVHDLAGSVPEWVSDHYQPFVGCLDRIGYADLCYGRAQSCPEARCVGDGKLCARGCMPASDDLSSTARGGMVVSTPACPLLPSNAPESIDPLSRSAGAAGFGVVRGGGVTDGACALAGFTRRHAVPGRWKAGFRCARGADVSTHPRVLTSYRWNLAACPSPSATVRVSISASDSPNAIYSIDALPSVGDPVYEMQGQAGVVDGLPCDALFVVHPSAAKLITVNVKITDATGCSAGQAIADLSGGGDVPPLGAFTIPVTSTSCN